jgi:hypothetical protein
MLLRGWAVDMTNLVIDLRLERPFRNRKFTTGFAMSCEGPNDIAVLAPQIDDLWTTRKMLPFLIKRHTSLANAPSCTVIVLPGDR